MRKKTFFHMIRLLCCLALVCCLIGTELTPALAVTQAEINNLKDDAGDLKKQVKELEKKLDALKDDRSAAMQRKNLLDEKISATSQQIANTEEQIAKRKIIYVRLGSEDSIHEKLRAFMITRDKVREMGYESGTIDVTDPSRPTFSP